MGWFFSSSSGLSKTEHAISRQEIERLVSRTKTKSLDMGEERLIEHILEGRRRGDGKISLFQMDEVLRRLENKKQISKFDRQGVVKIFKDYFVKKFGK